MTGWATITLLMDSQYHVYDKKPPTGLTLDSGIDERGWVDDKRYYGLSFGRYQDRRFKGHAEDMHCPIYSGVSCLFITETNNTGDDAEVDVYLPKQRNSERRIDGYEKVDSFTGKRWPEEKRKELKEEIENEYAFAPVIEPQEKSIPPDAVVTYTKD